MRILLISNTFAFGVMTFLCIYMVIEFLQDFGSVATKTEKLLHFMAVLVCFLFMITNLLGSFLGDW